MEIFLAKTAGYCSGVKRAVEIAVNTAKEYPKKIVTLGPLIHNNDAIERLSKMGVTPVNDLTEDIDIAIIRAHGVHKDRYDDLKVQ